MRRTWQERPVLGAWCTLDSPGVVEVMADGGYDFLILECQHGECAVTRLEPLLRAVEGTGVTPVVRVPSNDYFAIGHALDAGAQAIIVPMVNSAEEAQRAARAMRYPPAGTRSYAVTRAARTLGADPETVNGEVALLVMVETSTGLRNVADIAAVPGVDGIFVGPADLGLSLADHAGAMPPAPEVKAALDTVVEHCRRAGIVAGVAGGTEFADRGFGVLTVAVDRLLLAAGAPVVPAVAGALAGSGHDRS